MTLFQVKTRDLSWQDHTLNTEVMQAPARYGLLLNKHKTLRAGCQARQQLYERQRRQCLKEHSSSRILIHRQHLRLVQLQQELGTVEQLVSPEMQGRGSVMKKDKDEDPSLGTVERPVSSEAEDQGGAGEKERSRSAPGDLKLELPVIYIDTGNKSPDSSLASASSSIFVTELDSEAASPSRLLPTFSIPPPLGHSLSPLNVNSTQSMGQPRYGTPPPRNTPGNKAQSKIRSAYRGRQGLPENTRAKSMYNTRNRISTANKQSMGVRFATARHRDGADLAPNQHPDDAKADEGTRQDSILEAKVRAFVEDAKAFTLACKEGKPRHDETDPGLPGKKREAAKTPLVAQRYNSWKVDQDALLRVFDQFCQVQTPEELAKVMRQAAKLKAKVKVTRNQSIMPSIAAFKATRVFKSLVD